MVLTGNTIFISGGGTGIGKALAEMFHAKGNKVIIAGRRVEKLQEVVQANPGIELLELDITNSDSINVLTQKISQSYPDLNVLIHNAGIMRPEAVGENDIDTAKDIIATNLTGQIELNSKLVPIVQKNNGATIITVTSGLAFLPRADFPTYCATKAAVHSYTQSLRVQLQPHGVQVIELEPPYVQTRLTRPEQATDPRAMPLAEFIKEMTTILEDDSDVQEIQVERVQYQRSAESSGEYEARYKEFNNRFGFEV